MYGVLFWAGYGDDFLLVKPPIASSRIWGQVQAGISHSSGPKVDSSVSLLEKFFKKVSAAKNWVNNLKGSKQQYCIISLTFKPS